MFEFLKPKIYPEKFKSIQEKETFLRDIQDKLSSMFPGRTFKILLVPQFGTKNEMMKIIDWKEQVGNVIEVDDILASCESRKAQFDLTATERGVLIFRIEKGKEVMKDDIYAVLADKFVDLRHFTP